MNKALILSLFFWVSASTQANNYLSSFEQANNFFLVCTNIFNNTGDSEKYKDCIDANNEQYESIVRSNMEGNGKWIAAKNNADKHFNLCIQGIDNSPNNLIIKELSNCKNFYYKALILESR